MNYYEAHVTFLQGDGEDTYQRRLVAAMGWRFSQIDGDANLGSGVKHYATRQFTSRIGEQAVIRELLDMANHLEMTGAHIQRRKVEVVIFDDRSSKIRPCEDCAACQESRA